MRLYHEIEFAQKILRPLRPFDFDGSCRMTQLDVHAGILCLLHEREQGGKVWRVLCLKDHFAQRSCRLFRRDRIDVKARAPFKTGDLREFRNEFDVPMIKVPGFFVHR